MTGKQSSPVQVYLRKGLWERKAGPFEEGMTGKEKQVHLRKGLWGSKSRSLARCANIPADHRGSGSAALGMTVHFRSGNDKCTEERGFSLSPGLVTFSLPTLCHPECSAANEGPAFELLQ